MRRRRGAVALRAGPGAAADGHHLGFAGRAQAIVHVLLMRHRIEAVGLDSRTGVVAHLVVVRDQAEVVARVQPERLDAQVEVVALPVLPQKRSGSGVRRIVLQRASTRPVGGMVGCRPRRIAHPPRFRAVRPAHVDAPAVELGEVVAAFLHRYPRRDHDPRAQVVDLTHHGGRVGPELRVELPVAPVAVVAVVDDQHRYGEAEALELPRHGDKLLLRAVPVLALPEAGRPLGQHWRVPGDAGVVAHDVGVAVASGDVVVELAAAARHPAGHVGAELDPPQRRVVPQQAVAFAGHHERHHVLAVTLVQVDDAALQVEAAGGVEPHAVQPLPRPRGEVMLGVVQPLPRRPRCAAGRCGCPDRGSRPRSRAPPESAPARPRLRRPHRRDGGKTPAGRSRGHASRRSAAPRSCHCAPSPAYRRPRPRPRRCRPPARSTPRRCRGRAAPPSPGRAGRPAPTARSKESPLAARRKRWRAAARGYGSARRPRAPPVVLSASCRPTIGPRQQRVNETHADCRHARSARFRYSMMRRVISQAARSAP